LGGLSFWELSKRTYLEYCNNQLAAKSAQFAYYSILALAPLLILTIAGLAQLPLRGVIGDFKSVLEQGLPKNAYELVNDQIESLPRNTTGRLVAVNLFLFVYGGWKLFLTMGEGLNTALGAPPYVRRWRAHGVSLIFSVAMVAMLMFSLALLAVSSLLTQKLLTRLHVPGSSQWILHTLHWLIVTGLLLFLTNVIYRLVPAVKFRWQWLSPGSVFAVVAWTVASQAFRLYVAWYSPYNETYGALAGVVALLLWLYLVGDILMIGGQINGVIHQATGEAPVSVEGSDDADPRPMAGG
jgi:membrane protein